MGLDIRILASKDGHKQKTVGAWKNNYVLFDFIKYLKDPIVKRGESEPNTIEIPLTSENLFDLEYDLKKYIMSEYHSTIIEDILICNTSDNTWKEFSLTKDSTGWKWLHRARYMIENGWSISVWWWY